MGVDYERELKKLLEGNMGQLAKMKKTCDAHQCIGYETMESFPFMVIRGAGSFGTDLVALRGELSFPIEVKSSKYPKIYLSQPRLKEQLEVFLEECQKANTFPMSAFRYKGHKGDPWMVFTIKLEGLKYFSRVLNRKIPSLRQTPGGNYVMEWEKGMPMSDLLREIGKICSSIK